MIVEWSTDGKEWHNIEDKPVKMSFTEDIAEATLIMNQFHIIDYDMYVPFSPSEPSRSDYCEHCESGHLENELSEDETDESA